MQKILFVCPFMPEKNASQAGHRLAFEYIKSMAAHSVIDVVLLVKGKKKDPKDLLGLTNLNVVLHEEVSFLTYIINSISKPKLFSFLTRYSKKVQVLLTQIIKETEYDVVNLEFTQSFYHLKYLKKETKAAFHLSAHDILTQSHLRKPGLMSYFSNWTFRAESDLFSQADKIFVLSEKDRNLLHALFGSHLDIGLRPLPLPDYIYNVNRSAKTIEPQSLMFWGAMNRLENEKSIIQFIEQIFLPDLLLKYPTIKLYIVGSNPTMRLRKYESKSIIITGFVEDPTIYFEKASIGVIPLLYGAGVKLKTLEMLKTGMPVISTPIGVEGINLDGIKNISVKDMDGFKLEIARILNEQLLN